MTVPSSLSLAPQASFPTLSSPRVYRKIAWHLVPTIYLLIFLNYLDRTNIAFASIQMSKDLNLSPAQYGAGSGAFSFGYCLVQVPSQLLLWRFGATRWLAVIVFIWGVMATCMATVSSLPGLILVRTLLGAAESGTFPGYWYYFTTFFPDAHITLPISVTDTALMWAQVVGAPLAAGLLHLHGTMGLSGWQWIFILEGVPTAILGVLLPLLLPTSPSSAKWLESPEADLVQEQVHACRHGRWGPISVPAMLRSAFTNRDIYIVAVVKLCKDLMAYVAFYWTPLFIESMLHRSRHGGDHCAAWQQRQDSSEGAQVVGYEEVLLSGIPFTCAALASLLMSWNSQRTRERRWHILCAYVAAGCVCIIMPWLLEAGMIMGFIGLNVIVALTLCPNACLVGLATDAGEGPALSLNLALFNALSNTAGIVGPWLAGVVLQSTCSFDAVFVVFGVALMAGAGLVLAVKPRKEKKVSVVELGLQADGMAVPVPMTQGAPTEEVELLADM